MKLLLSVLLATSFACCKNKTVHPQPDAQAKYSITIEIQATERTPTVEEKEEVFQLLKANAESSGIACQSIEMITEKQRITFNLITAGFDLEESSRIINKLKLGILPFELKVVEAKKL